MYLRTLAFFAVVVLTAGQANAQLSVSRGANLSVDVASDGRLAIDLRGDVWIVPGGGGEARQLTQNHGSVLRPRWSPDASQIVFSADSDYGRGLWIYDFGDEQIRNLANGSSLDRYASWHPAGETVVFSSDVNGSGFDLWEIDVATELRWRISNRQGDETEAAWSTDGRDLVYVHRHDGRWSLILRRKSEPEEVLLTSRDKLAAPSFRPDGSLITFIRSSGGKTSLDMIILSRPRLTRSYATKEPFSPTPVSWLDRHRMYYSAGGQIRQRQFDAWSSRPVNFRATIQAQQDTAVERERLALEWPDEPLGRIVIHAFRLFDGVSSDYQHDKDIVIDGGRITAVEDHRDRPGTIVIDMGDLTVIPGLIDADARLPGNLGASHGPDLLTMGVTTVVGSQDNIDELNRMWSGKAIPGPRLLSASDWTTGPLVRPDLDPTAAVVTSRATGLTTGQALPTQFRAMQAIGLSSLQILRGMGVNAAGALMADPYLGRVAKGAAADLVFIDGDPVHEIDDLLNVVAVVRNGRFYSVSGLIDRAKSAESVE